LADFGIVLNSDEMTSDSVDSTELRVGLIDCHRFSQECLMKAFEGMLPRLVILPFPSVEDCMRAARTDLDLIMYYSHANETSEAAAMQNVAALRQAFEPVPLIVLSDAEDAQQPKTIRSTLRSGAHGFIPTRTTGIPVTFAAIRFVKAGGTFAPLDVLLAQRPDRVAAAPETGRQNRLTSRQMAVLSHLQQGKANKIIAHELSMSESTVKVHVRNIMRKMGATNRTQAAYKAQMMWSGSDFMKAPDLSAERIILDARSVPTADRHGGSTRGG
jgi:DNA-binding NarL/FixJ family response regulator